MVKYSTPFFLMFMCFISFFSQYARSAVNNNMIPNK